MAELAAAFGRPLAPTAIWDHPTPAALARHALEPLARALARGHRIYCLLHGSATNNDGFSNGLTAPNPQAQEAVLRDAYANAGIAPEAVDYVKTHGTGMGYRRPPPSAIHFAAAPAGRKEPGMRLGSGSGGPFSLRHREGGCSCRRNAR